MQGRPKAIIDGFGCMPPSLDYLRLPLVEISEGGPKAKSRNRSLIARGTGSFESISLQRRVNCELDFGRCRSELLGPSRLRGGQLLGVPRTSPHRATALPTAKQRTTPA